jgi:two-component system, NarL family, response regulator LiaR
MIATEPNTTTRSSTLIRVLVVDDHPVVRKGLRSLLAEYEDIQFVGEACDGHEAIQQCENLNPDVILMDLIMPNLDGVGAIQRLAANRPHERILVLTSYAQDDQVLAAIKAGAVGYLLKDTPIEDLVKSIRQVYRGELSLSPLIARKLLLEMSKPHEQDRAIQTLTQRESEILRMVTCGKEDYEISAALNIAEVTVRSHIRHILEKLHVNNRVQAALYAVRSGLISLSEI